MFVKASCHSDSESDGMVAQGAGALALPAVAEILDVRAALDEHPGPLALLAVSNASSDEFAIKGHIQDAPLIY